MELARAELQLGECLGPTEEAAALAASAAEGLEMLGAAPRLERTRALEPIRAA